MANTYGFSKSWSCDAFEAQLKVKEHTIDGDHIGIDFNYSGAIHEALIATFKERMTELLDDMLNASRKEESED